MNDFYLKLVRMNIEMRVLVYIFKYAYKKAESK
jgi:hypothetical protein